MKSKIVLLCCVVFATVISVAQEGTTDYYWCWAGASYTIYFSSIFPGPWHLNAAMLSKDFGQFVADKYPDKIKADPIQGDITCTESANSEAAKNGKAEIKSRAGHPVIETEWKPSKLPPANQRSKKQK